MATAISFDESPEYETLRECHTMMIDLLKTSIGSFGSELFAKKLIPLSVYENLPPVSRPAESTREIIIYLMNLVQHSTEKYHDIVSAVKELGPWTETITDQLEATYARKQSHVHTPHTSLSPMASNLEESLKKREIEKQNFEKKIQELRQLSLPHRSVSPAAVTISNDRVSEEALTSDGNGTLSRTVNLVRRLVEEINAILRIHGNEAKLTVALTLPSHLLTPQWVSSDVEEGAKVVARVLLGKREALWDLDTLHEKLVTLRDMANGEDMNSVMDISETPTLLGVACFSLWGLGHDVTHKCPAPIVTVNGEKCGHLNVVIGPNGTKSGLCLGASFRCQVNVVEATGLPVDYSCKSVYCRYKFWEEEMMEVHCKFSNGRLHHFQHEQFFTVTITEEFVKYLDNGMLAVEVWGEKGNPPNIHREIGGVADKPRKKEGQCSVSNELRKLTKRLKLWVNIEELNEEGKYVPVETRSKPGVRVGGMFRLQHGQSRKIYVTVNMLPKSGQGTLCIASISSVSMGSIDIVNSDQQQPNSYHTDDLERLWDRWLADMEASKELIEDQYRNESESVKQKSLYAQRLMLVSQKNDVVKLQKTSFELAGLSTEWKEDLGFEITVPILFLDYPSNSDIIMETGLLQGEKEETMIDLDITTYGCKDSASAAALWNSASHNSDHLNKVTQNGYRVYAILKVGVALAYPSGTVLELKKRICLKVYRKKNNNLVRSISSDLPCTGCGMMYDVVVGVPRTQDVVAQSTNPFLMELGPSDDPQEKLRTVCNLANGVLSLDRYKQDEYLKKGGSKSRTRVGSLTLSRSIECTSSGSHNFDDRFVFNTRSQSISLPRGSTPSHW